MIYIDILDNSSHTIAIVVLIVHVLKMSYQCISALKKGLTSISLALNKGIKFVLNKDLHFMSHTGDLYTSFFIEKRSFNIVRNIKFNPPQKINTVFLLFHNIFNLIKKIIYVFYILNNSMLYVISFLGSTIPFIKQCDHIPHVRLQTCPSFCYPVGGSKSYNLTFLVMSKYLSFMHPINHLESCEFKFHTHLIPPVMHYNISEKKTIYVHIPLLDLVNLTTINNCHQIANLHDIKIHSNISRFDLQDLFSSHSCNERCSNYISEFSITSLYDTIFHDPEKQSPMNSNSNKHASFTFPSNPLTPQHIHAIISSACKRMEPHNFEEAGCAVCGQLIPCNQLLNLTSIQNHLHVLSVPGITRQERTSISETITEQTYALDHQCNHVCYTCEKIILQGRIPKNSLASGLWLGTVPNILSSLRFVEKLLIARIHHSCCAIKISSGMRKMKANAIAFQSPINKIYEMLPPPRSDIDEVLAIIFTGPSKPSFADLTRTPFLIRRNHVKHALQWLILNHKDYENVKFSESNLLEYPEHIPPVSIEYQMMSSNKTPEGVSVFDIEEEDGTEKGPCSFTVHGLTGDQLQTLSGNAIKAKALQHLNNHGKMLAIGHSEHPESIWNNPQLYPQMFPWLFPYGLGGIGTVSNLSDKEHKRRLLMYHDKRFQKDPNFPFVAFSHEQIKTATTNSFLLAKKPIFHNITERLLHLNMNTLNNLLQQLSEEEFVQPTTDEEKQCFKLLTDLDHLSGTIKGSTTSKKWMRNEIWSLVAHLGAPFWYITLSPADIKHPICLYYAATNEQFKPEILPYDERLRHICSNPVAGARFFYFIITTFIKVVLGYGEDHEGLFGQISAYYGTVEQQGRLTLHLHMILWLAGNLTPQEMRNQLLNPNSDFKDRIIAWIESCQVGEFLSGTYDEISEKVKLASTTKDYNDPTETLPLAPPPSCLLNCGTCNTCTILKSWWKQYTDTTDDLILKSNVHNCNYKSNSASTSTFKSCRDNKYGNCKARFPRPIFDNTKIDPETGTINLKKKEPWINSISPALTYLLRCNTDVTCMWSGTALKAVIIYISDYITKSGLKTHVIFDAIKSILNKNTEILNKDISDKDKARQLLCKIVNILATKTELGSPMICMYLLNHPDHYTSHNFIPFYWRTFVDNVLLCWNPTDINIKEPNLRLYNIDKKIVGISPVDDYIYRPTSLEKVNLYNWRRQCSTLRISKKKNTAHLDPEDEFNLNGLDNDDSEISKTPKGSLKFLIDHPFYKTHVCTYSNANDKKVINFIGSPLPRIDEGDKEFYCCTMLTFFKPWRTGHDLKTAHQSWNECFSLHKFSERELQIMKNFNIKYECLDARDDYRSQLKRGAQDTLFMFGNHDNNPEHDEQNTEDDCFLNEDSYDASTKMPIYGPQELKLQAEAAQIRAVLTCTGWNNIKNPNYEMKKFQPFSPSCNLTGPQWKIVTQLMKKKKLDKITNKPNVPLKHLYKFLPNNVKIISKYYLQCKFYTTNEEDPINGICSFYSLNEDQERAFKIISHHALVRESEQLKMYIGGMGGTGKTQVIRALSCFFADRNEPYRFISVAPTGTAAALLSGSTYHSKFAINDFQKKASEKSLSNVRNELIRVDYVFLDEVSMLSCHDLYRISAQLAYIFNCHDLPFGNKNMIFAGDFGQLPPPIGGETVALYSRTIGQYATRLKSQEEAMGKILWHQFTTVVILRKNMRQKKDSEDDDKLRTALMNMRYKDCSTADIAFLKSKISSQESGKPSICDNKFTNISIITAKNIQKDEINHLGCEKFAKMTGQFLTHFFSEDIIKPNKDNEVNYNPLNKNAPNIPYELQKEIWNLPHSTADKQIPGKLSLCFGMPIMIKHNEATELCITNGQEATIMGWKSCQGSWQQQMIDILFVKLTNPPTTIQLNGLPENVVALTRNEKTITCKLRNDTKITLNRSQVEILPNFAMTDFASQGKTRMYNVVDLYNCRSHQAYYTALSRGATANGTLILQSFDSKKITGKASGALRQEFRELELLDEITRLHYHDSLPESVIGTTRHSLINSYRENKGHSYIPPSIHPSLIWNTDDQFLQPNKEEIDWKIISKDKNSNALISPIYKKNYISSNKRKKHPCNIESDHPSKKMQMNPTIQKQKHTKCLHKKEKNSSAKTTITPSKDKKTDPTVQKHEHNMTQIPNQFTWSENSCAFDAYFSLLYALWYTNKAKWNEVFMTTNRDFLGHLAQNFVEVDNGTMAINTARDQVRHTLASKHPTLFTWGQYTSLYDLMEYTLQTLHPIMQSHLICKNSHTTGYENSIIVNNNCLLSITTCPNTPSVQHWMNNFEHQTSHVCPICNTHLKRTFRIIQPIPLIFIDFTHYKIHLNHDIKINIENEEHQYNLRGIMYYSNNHFTSRFISHNKTIWFHDGITTGQEMVIDGTLDSNIDLSTYNDMCACAAMYELRNQDDNTPLMHYII